MSDSQFIAIVNHSFSYGAKQALNNVTLSIKENSIHGILGSNGAGKTTLFNNIFHNQQFSHTIHVNGHCQKSIAYLESELFFYAYMTGNEYLQIISKSNNEHISKWNDLFDLPLHDYVTSYSTGMKKKLALLGILLLQKQIIILDEPFNGLDFMSSETVNHVIQRLKKINKTVILSSHILETLTNNSDRISILENGSVLKTFEKEDFDKLDKLVSEKYRSNIENVVDALLK
jgi:ABC-2 type transport system ATP-binding protein